MSDCDHPDYLEVVHQAALGAVSNDETLVALLRRTSTDVLLSVLSDGPASLVDPAIDAIELGLESSAAVPHLRDVGLLVCDCLRDHFIHDVRGDINAAILYPEDFAEEMRRAEERERARDMNRGLR